MKVNYNQFLAITYSDIFNWPLTASELRAWEIKSETTGAKLVEYKNGYYFLPGREKLIKQRLEKEKISGRKKMMAEVVTNFLAKIPTVEAIFLTGSVAVGSARNDGDIDLMIITTPNTLWLTRMIVVSLLKGLRSYGNGSDRICPNIFLDSNHLEIKERNLYTAHEVLQAKCLYDKSNIYYLWLKNNEWTKEYLPKAYKHKINQTNIQFPMAKHQSTNVQKLSIGNWILKNWVLGFGLIEFCAFIFQYLYQKPKQTNEQIGWGYAFFHPRNLSEKVMGEFEKRPKTVK